MKRLIWAGALAAIAATPVAALDKTIEEVDVQFDLAAVKSQAAADFWGDLEADLEEAIIEKVGPNIGDAGTEVDIDIDELTMSDSLQTALGEDSVLKGLVHIHDSETDEAATTYHLTLTVKQVGSFIYGENFATIMTIPTEEVYATMVDAFANNVVEKLPQ